MSFAVGSLVRARGRDWVVLPESSEDLLILRPLGGGEDETTGVYLPLERVEAASFPLPDPSQLGDYRSCQLLRDALRLGFRSSAGPFRCFARLAVEPRPYQLVPLLMALKLDPVRLLIADDVGIGKTIEAALIVRELIDRGEVNRFAVLCPPQIAEQWQVELRDKFHLDAELVLPSTATRLERACRPGQSIYERYPYVIVSTDFIKSDRRRDDFLRACPELVVVDEAHTCVWAGDGRSGRHQRHQLVRGLAAEMDRHLILVTATPHSGKEEAFRSLLALLHPDFANLPDDLSGPANEHHRRRLAAHFVQRRRGDIRHYLQADTPFPEREEAEETYTLSPEYKRLFQKVLDYARETVTDEAAKLPVQRQRVRWWSALALLRSMASSPAAAAATLRTRAANADAESPEEADAIGRRTVLDLEDESSEGLDIIPGCLEEDLTIGFTEITEEDGASSAASADSVTKRLLHMAREADALQGRKDAKLQKIIPIVEALLRDGFHPILFCRFIPTAEYVAAALRDQLKGVEVVAVTGNLPPAEREYRVEQLAQAEKRVLVCTDCLSEGINLQQYFNAVIHYDLSWNPTRHEQREGRVDRYGQPSPRVRTLTYYGTDNQIDGIVLDVLLRKHRAIRNSLGISVPLPLDSERVIQAVLGGMLLRGRNAPDPTLFDEIERTAFFQQWQSSAEREKRSRTMFAQETIKVDEVLREVEAARAAVGSSGDVASFCRAALTACRAAVSGTDTIQVDLTDAPRALRDALDVEKRFSARFELPVAPGQLYLSRTHPVVEGLANFVLNSALDPMAESVARRCGVIRTGRVTRRTTLLLVRMRFHIVARHGNVERPLFAEDCQVLAFAGSPQNAEWLPADQADVLFQAEPEGNVLPEQARDFLRKVIDGFEHLLPYLEQSARRRGEELLDAHRRVRSAARAKGVSYRVEAQLPPDVLGVYVYLP
ncbi:MAG: DEAD/DEAH box helicase, partial [Gemmatales bacterium]|nr:DEAD/DEAH box helicase [Gemmatales bacterium]MDW8386907.1 helicase-related protein [Gemmatales bacterium]